MAVTHAGRPLAVFSLLVAACLVAGCRTRLLAPRDASGPGSRTAAPPAVVYALPGPAPPTGIAAQQALFGDLTDLLAPLATIKGQQIAHGAPPRVTSFVDLERAVYRKYGRRGTLSGRVRNAIAIGTTGYVPIGPTALANLLLHPETARHLLMAETFRLDSVQFDTGAHSRRRYRVEMLDRGKGPFRFNFRFSMCIERWNLQDGSVILRYDPYPRIAAEKVSHYRGVAVLEPSGTGCRVSEVVVMGTSVWVPGFLRGTLRQESRDLYRIRAERIALKAAEWHAWR